MASIISVNVIDTNDNSFICLCNHQGGGTDEKFLTTKKKKKEKEKNFTSCWFRLKTLYPSYVLLKEAYLVSKSISLHNKPPWFASSLTKASPQYYFTSL